MEIRFGNKKDLQFIIDSDEETRIYEKRTDLKLNSEDVKNIEKELKNKEIFIVEEDGEKVGFITFKSNFDVKDLRRKVFWVSLIFVKKEHRGKGISHLLWDKVIKIAKQKGYDKIYIEIYDGNMTSVKIHKKVGFKPLMVATGHPVTIFSKDI